MTLPIIIAAKDLTPDYSIIHKAYEICQARGKPVDKVKLNQELGNLQTTLYEANAIERSSLCMSRFSIIRNKIPSNIQIPAGLPAGSFSTGAYSSLGGYDYEFFLVQALTHVVCPNDPPPPPAPAGEPSPATRRIGVTQTNRLATEMPPTYTPDLVPVVLATGAAAYVTKSWWSRAFAWVGRAAVTAGLAVTGALTCFMEIFVGPLPTQQHKPDWT